MLERQVMIEGKLYDRHELTQMNMLIGEAVVPLVHSWADGNEDEGIYSHHALPWQDGITVAQAELQTWELPFFDEYVDADEKLDEVLDILTDEQAEQVPDAFREWKPDTDYKLGDRRRYESLLYKCVQAHTSQVGWEPPNAPSLWSRIGEGDIPEWVQPTGAHDAYAKGDKVRHVGKVWRSEIDANVYEPGVYGWAEE